METVLSIIGLFVVVKFCIRHRRMIMDKAEFRRTVKALRESILGGHTRFAHRELDDLVQNVLGAEPDEETLDDSLQGHIIQHIAQLKAIKEQEQAEKQAAGILEQIKAALESK